MVYLDSAQFLGNALDRALGLYTRFGKGVWELRSEDGTLLSLDEKVGTFNRRVLVALPVGHGG